ncbi:hypothetical protein EPN18_09425 [bacterium]|nr:MAG: hypothetical protein EPN18_09425 [bacterium]
MKKVPWQITLGVALLALSAALCVVHYVVFRDIGQIISWFLMAGAFLPLEVLFVTVIIQRLLERRETAARREKLNMVIGIFFGEFGTPLLSLLSLHDRNLDKIRKDLMPDKDETEGEFNDASKRINGYECGFEITQLDLQGLKKYLAGKREFIVRLLENPALLEHESFTDLLWAVAHLMEELSHREEFASLPASDLSHLAIDVKRAYSALLSQWLLYMSHLKVSYPYLFSLAVRTNPFDKSASAVVRS